MEKEEMRKVGHEIDAYAGELWLSKVTELLIKFAIQAINRLQF